MTSKLLIAFVLGAASWSMPAWLTAAETIEIGCVAPLTGPQAHLGKDIENGARLAVDTINASTPTIGGQPVQFVLLVEDDQADPKTATVVAQKLVDEGVKGVVGHLNSGASIPASRIYAENGVPQVSPASTAVAYTNQGFDTTYRLMANDSQQGKALGQYATGLGKRVVVVDDRTAYGQGLIDEVVKSVEASGGKVVGREYTTDKSTDFTAILTSLKAKRPDVVVFGGMDPQAAPMMRQMRTLGMKTPFMGGDGMQSAEFIKLAGPAAEGAIGSSPGLPLEQMPGGADFTKRFGERFGKVQIYAPFSHDSAVVLIQAMLRAGSAEPKQYLPELAKTQLDGVIGPIAFDAKGDLRDGPVTLYQVKNGQWQPVETIGGPAAK
ncbi:MAG: branched-chain amino acid ABC transporter substrate-binding protein [Lamprocystis purpurea]|uniref:branched-chain amino acid ABC transporter substrate-binding protein n=1 Tax=Lamprocystis purpurea TaxID=61598 RepID=UPI0003A78468|nr:branched-chain amino acid ABC transporter substrate-binding protein [Lamprocystis purpurea]MBV5273949.1 branched-chain amino acid ABC transporter substrate-binding protein [Lamprocystis purpurea]